jgi:hypothetical protein
MKLGFYLRELFLELFILSGRAAEVPDLLKEAGGCASGL